MRNFFRRSIVIGLLILTLVGVISCEKDFTDIGTSIVGNTKFDTKDTILEVLVSQRPNIDAIRGDNLLTGSIGEYWLGIYQNDKKQYEKIEASIVTQLAAFRTVNLTDGVVDTTKVTNTFDNAFLKFPYLATKTGTDKKTVKINGKDSIITIPVFEIDDKLGTSAIGVDLKVYENTTFLSSLNLVDPTKPNVYKTDAVYGKGDLLNADSNFKFIPNPNDTLYIYDRFLKDGVASYKDTLKLSNANPFLVIPLDRDKLKKLFFDRFNGTELTSQELLNNYFRGLIIEVSGDENSLVPFRFSNPQQIFLNPTLELNYTTTVEHKTKNTVVDTLRQTLSVNLSGIQNRIYKMTPESVGVGTDQIVIQGTAGKMADVKILQGNQLQDLKSKNWLINDATVTFYIDQTRDTTAIPQRLFLYRESLNYSRQILDAYQEGFSVFSGNLEKDGIKNESYSFKITDYISNILGPNSHQNDKLVLKAFNETDTPVINSVLDSVVKTYNWNPRAVTIFNQFPSNGTIKGTRKAQLKISYTEKK
ncbi:MAG: DUF4270 family protein [Polaribacter sp.]